MKKKILYQLLLLLFPVLSFAQPAAKDITGVWKGELYVDSTKKSYPFELTISEEKGKFTGYSRIAFEENGIPQVVFRDHKIKVTNDAVVIEDDNQLTKASSVSQAKEVKKTMVLALTSMDSSMQLSGTWSTNKTRHYLAATGSVQMQHKIDFKSTEIFKKLEELSIADKLSFTKQPTKEEPEPTFNKVILTDIAKVERSKKAIRPLNSVAKPKAYTKPKDIPLAMTEKPVTPVVKPVAEPVAIVKKAIQPAAPKPLPAAKAKDPVVAKIDKPVVMPATVKETKPVPQPVARQNIPASDQNAAIDVAKRSISNEQSLFYKSDSLQLTLYDNGEIDGDTVSVLLNGKVIIAKQGLTTKPNVHTIYFDRNTPDSQMLVMYAENLGSIPPNTGLLVVREGASVYELRFSADLKTNAAIILRRKRGD
ncbi:hypothetical protein BH11BAC4_BH11BAC4_18580 [soil metagenome]